MYLEYNTNMYLEKEIFMAKKHFLEINHSSENSWYALFLGFSLLNQNVLFFCDSAKC